MNYTGAKPIVPMKWVIILSVLFALLLGGVIASKAQTIKVSDKVLKDTVIANKSYKLYLDVRGGKYVIRISKTTGKEYKQYIKSK